MHKLLTLLGGIQLISNTKNIISFLLKNYIKEVRTSVDMTCGNGHDSKLILELKNPNIHYAFDIQESARQSSFDLLTKEGLDLSNFSFILDSHAKLNEYVNEYIDLFIYNLGYLPGGNHEITTRSEQVMESLFQALDLLNENGHILITFYPGHPEGEKEAKEIVNFLNQLDQKSYNVIQFNFINQVNKPPFVVMVERR